MLSTNIQSVINYVSGIEAMEPLTLSGVSFYDFLLTHKRFPIIAITGQSGVGKTTFTDILCHRLIEQLDSSFMWISPPSVQKYTGLPQMSPYLPIIKASSDWLTDQILWQKNQDLFRILDEAILSRAFIESKNSVIVMDFSIIQVLVYAQLKIKWKVQSDFTKIFNQSFKTIPKPDFLIHITANSDTILNRIQSRGTFIDDQIQRMTEDLHHFYDINGRDILSGYYEGIPVIRVDTDGLDLIHNPDHQLVATSRIIQDIVTRTVV